MTGSPVSFLFKKIAAEGQFGLGMQHWEGETYPFTHFACHFSKLNHPRSLQVAIIFQRGRKQGRNTHNIGNHEFNFSNLFNWAKFSLVT